MPHLISSCSLIFFGEWSDSGFEFIAKKHLIVSEEDSLMIEKPEQIIEMMIIMFHNVIKATQDYYAETSHYVYITPQHFELFVESYKRLYRQRE